MSATISNKYRLNRRHNNNFNLDARVSPACSYTPTGESPKRMCEGVTHRLAEDR